MLLNTASYCYGGRFASRAQWIHPERCIDTYELIVVTEGCVCMEEEESDYVLTPDTALLLEPGKRHRGFQASQERVAFYWIHFNDFCLSEHTKLAKCLHLYNPYAVTLLCRQLLDYADEKNTEAGASVPDALLHVLLKELEKQSREAKDSADLLTFQIREWIRINSDQNLTVSAVSQHFGYNEDYLSRLFRKQCGHGLKFEIDSMKLREIKKLLLNTDFTLYEVAKRAGMEDYKLFLKFFKYHEGVTPSEFRSIYYMMHTNNR